MCFVLFGWCLVNSHTQVKLLFLLNESVLMANVNLIEQMYKNITLKKKSVLVGGNISDSQPK